MEQVVFLHGLKGSPQGTKASFLKKYFAHCSAPALPQDLGKRLKIVEETICEPVWLVGSSLGGLTALEFAMKKPELVKGMVLLAPAVGLFDHDHVPQEHLDLAKRAVIPKGIPCTVIAASKDHIIPFLSIKKLVGRSPDSGSITLIKANDEHNLNQSLPILLDSLKKIMQNK